MNDNMLYVMNCVMVICFTVLAVLFSKWWIILFSGLFMFYREIKKKD